MKILALSRSALGVCASVVLLAACSSGGSLVSPSVEAQAIQPLRTGRDALRVSKTAAPLGLKLGLYVLASANVYGFPTDNHENSPPFCSLGGFTNSNIAFDAKGRMIAPDFASSTITVYAAPTISRACGKILGVVRDPYGQPVDAASVDAVKGRIVVVAQQQVDICSLQRGCTKSLPGPYLEAPASVALSRNGDCWAEGDAVSGPGILYYFKGCDTGGQVTSGYEGGGDNAGGLDIDKYGNIVSIFANYGNSPALYVYSGCSPACTLLSGPLPLHGNGTYGHLNKDSTEFAAADSQYSSIDVYKYSPTSLKYQYGFNNGLSNIDGVAFNRPSEQ